MDTSEGMGKVLSGLIAEDIVDETILILDSTTVKVHQHGNGVKNGIIAKKQGEAEES